MGTRVRITIDVEANVRRRLKTAAANRSVTSTEYVFVRLRWSCTALCHAPSTP